MLTEATDPRAETPASLEVRPPAGLKNQSSREEEREEGTHGMCAGKLAMRVSKSIWFSSFVRNSMKGLKPTGCEGQKSNC